MNEDRKLVSMLLVRWGVLFLLLIIAALAIVPAIASPQYPAGTEPNSYNELNSSSKMEIVALPAVCHIVAGPTGCG